MKRINFALALCLAGGSAAAGSLLALTFDAPLPALHATAQPRQAHASASLAPGGSIDQYMGAPSAALLLQADFSAMPLKAAASAKVSTGRLKIDSREGDLAKLSLHVDLNVSSLHPVQVLIASYDTQGRRTGRREATLLPPIAGSFYRHGIDLDQTRPLDGRFDPLAPQIEFSFV